MLFVDHDAARLAGHVDERWRLAGGTVTVASGAPAPDLTAIPRRNGVVIIEVGGLEAGSLARLHGLAGVVSVHPDASAGDEPGRPIGPIQLAVADAESDSVLRQLLSWDGLHVRAVHPEVVWPAPEAVRPAPEAVRPAPEAVRPAPEAMQ